MSPLDRLSGGPVAALISALDDSSREVKVAALEAVVRLPLAAELWRNAAPRIVRMLERDGPSYDTLIPAAAVPVATVRAEVRRHLSSSQPDARRFAVTGLARVGDQHALPGLLEWLQDPSEDDYARVDASELLVNLDVSSVRRDVRRLAANDPLAEVRLWSCVALAKGGEVKPLRRILRSFDKGTINVRYNPLDFSDRLRLAGPFPDSVSKELNRHLPSDGWVQEIVFDLLSDRSIQTPTSSIREDIHVSERVRLGESAAQSARRALSALRTDGTPGLREAYDEQDLRFLHPSAANDFVVDLYTAMEPGDIEVSNKIVKLVHDLYEPLQPDAARFVEIYAANRDIRSPVADQIAWTAARAGAPDLLEQLEAGLRSAEPSMRKTSAELVADAAAYMGDGYPPIFGGGSGPPPLVGPTELLDFGTDDIATDTTMSLDVETRVSRIPHIDLPFEGPVNPGATFNVHVYADETPSRHDEESTPIELSLPFDVDAVNVEVSLLTSEHFRVVGSSEDAISIQRLEPASTLATFTVTVLTDEGFRELGMPPESLRTGALTAVFGYKGREAGKVTRALKIAVGGTDDNVKDESLSIEPDRSGPGALFAESVDGNADLRIQVVAVGRIFRCRVSTDLVQMSAGDADWHLWRPEGDTRTLVGNYMALFTATQKKPEQRLDALRGAGKQLFRAAPEIFRRTFWRIIDENRPLETISIVSDEPYIPWELMIPHDDSHDDRAPLGVEFAVGRWIDQTSIAAPRRIRLPDSYAIAPAYAKPLEKARDEADSVVKQFGGQVIDPATYTHIRTCLHEHMAGLIHFACHGTISSSGEQEILLDDDATLAPAEVEGSVFASDVRSVRPLIFINACEIGRQAPALIGVGGFSATFIRIGASGVVAALWSVKDTVAREVAQEFYRRVKAEPNAPFSVILRELRARAYGGPDGEPGEDSFAAYVFYGDPLARAAVGPAP